MKLQIKFHPLLFQASLAAGGVALMPFNYLQFAVPHGEGLVTYSNISWSSLTSGQYSLHAPLVAIMLAFTLIHFVLTGYFLYRLATWLMQPGAYRAFMNVPHKNQNAGIFAPVASLSMTANVILAPLGFFVPQVSENLQALMLPALIFFGALLLALLVLEVTALKTWFAKGVDRTQFNFIWLLDVFAAGLVALTGSGIAAMASNGSIAAVAAAGTGFTVVLGSVWLLYKLAYLVYVNLKAAKLPDSPILPAFFLVVPICCLFGISGYRLATYLDGHIPFDLGTAQSVMVTASYALTVVWGLAAVYLIRDYFRNYFAKSPFAPPQWGIV